MIRGETQATPRQARRSVLPARRDRFVAVVVLFERIRLFLIAVADDQFVGHVSLSERQLTGKGDSDLATREETKALAGQLVRLVECQRDLDGQEL